MRGLLSLCLGGSKWFPAQLRRLELAVGRFQCDLPTVVRNFVCCSHVVSAFSLCRFLKTHEGICIVNFTSRRLSLG